MLHAGGEKNASEVVRFYKVFDYTGEKRKMDSRTNGAAYFRFGAGVGTGKDAFCMFR
ncbi:hypothetical protein EZS27_020009 [termite gut metagenome]|uniref:Uncharacterized protein n=1 Tax=termite gut metagenome TaxID=433724 RepID=A0A5J4RBM7_9ZZZZ